MTPNDEPPPIEKDLLREQLFEVRREGFEGVDLNKVGGLLAFVEQLAPTEKDDRRRLEIAVAEAIKKLPKEQKAASLWFGLDEAAKGKDKDEREALAAAAVFVTPSGFRNHRQKPYMDAISEALFYRARPDEADTETEQEQTEYLGSLLDSDQASAEQLPEVQYEDMGPGEKAYAYLVAQHEAEEKRDWVAVAMNVFVAALCVGLIVLLIVGVLRVPFVNHGEPTKKIPAEGTVISADDGSTVSNPEERKPDQPVSLASGSTLRVCNLTYQAIKNCQFKKLVHPLVVERGDLLWIGQSLRAQGAIPMPYLTLKATRRSIEEQFAALKMSVDWPGHHGWFRQSFFEMAYGENGPVSLAYVPGSTELRGPSVTEHIANLPDGIMEGGISLASLGPPVTCGGCAARYRRYVFFKVKVETPKKQTHINNY